MLRTRLLFIIDETEPNKGVPFLYFFSWRETESRYKFWVPNVINWAHSLCQESHCLKIKAIPILPGTFPSTSFWTSPSAPLVSIARQKPVRDATFSCSVGHLKEEW